MDTKLLVKQIKKVIAEFAKENKIVTSVQLVRAYSGYESSSFVLAISCPWTRNYSSIFAKTQEVVTKVYDCLDLNSLEMIHSVNVFENDYEVENFVKSAGDDWMSEYGSEFINPKMEMELV